MNERMKISEVEKEKNSIKKWRKIMIVFAVTILLPIIYFSWLLISGNMQMSEDDDVTARFKLSRSMKSSYTNILQGSYDYNFAFCSDPHLTSEGDSVFPELDAFIRANKTGFVVFGGDLTFLGLEAEYDNFITNANKLTVPVYPAIGNHDLYNNGWNVYYRKLGPSVYSFYGGNAKFVVIDSADSEIGDLQMDWIRKELKENQQPLLFVISHVPMYGGNSLSLFPQNKEKEELVALFEKYEVDIVFQGHYHGFADVTVNNVRYITCGSFSETLLDSGFRQFISVKVYGPEIKIEEVIVGKDLPIQYKNPVI
ncbi:MAG: metallophosphoesterase [Candidatus Omnitrophica bacterium]|nr:metallophosphoesterase [Candidatus Omnitrophota bacterium]